MCPFLRFVTWLTLLGMVLAFFGIRWPTQTSNRLVAGVLLLVALCPPLALFYVLEEQTSPKLSQREPVQRYGLYALGIGFEFFWLYGGITLLQALWS